MQSWVGVSLERITPAAETIQRLLRSAARHITDSRIKSVSAETRFTSAYTAIRMLADVGLHANGFRTRTSVPGHHIVAINSLTLTVAVGERVIARLDALRRLRNAAEYSGDLIPESAVTECVARAEELRALVLRWLKKNKPASLKSV